MRWNIWVAVHLYTLWNKKCAVWLFLDVSFRVIKQKCIFNFAADHLQSSCPSLQQIILLHASCHVKLEVNMLHRLLTPLSSFCHDGVFLGHAASQKEAILWNRWITDHWRIVRIHHVVWLMKYYWFCLLFLPFSYLQYWLLGCFTHWSCYVAAWSRRWKDKHTTTVQSISLLV